ncbi:MAG: VWA domain-containing protein [Dehalococcoidia bacterium]|nr:VWA domain-containing protein [Dehalococcoidia bacterium]
MTATEPKRRLMVDDSRATYLAMLVDMTESMGKLKGATIDACNEYLNTLKKDVETQGFIARVDVFNSRVGVVPLELSYVWKAVKDAPVLTEANYKPDGMTPLHDSIAWVIEKVEAAKRPRDTALVVIQTDGYENCSKEYTREAVAALIKKKQDKDGWQFVFLGCGLDAMAVGNTLNIAAGNTLSYGRDRMETMSAYSSLSEGTKRYARSSSIASSNFFAGPATAAGATPKTTRSRTKKK